MTKKLNFKDGDHHIYYTSKNKKLIELFFEEDDLCQLRFHLHDENPEIKNKLLTFSSKHFLNFKNTSHEKHFERQNKKVIEYYYDGELDHYAEIEQTSKFKKTECYSRNGRLFSQEIIEFNKVGKPIKTKQYIKNIDGSIHQYEGSLEIKNH